MGYPVIVFERCDPKLHPVGAIWRVLTCVLYRFTGAVVVQIKAATNYFRRYSRVYVISNPSLGQDDADDDIVLPDLPAGPFVAAMGRFTDQKNFEMLIEAFGRIADQYPDWSLVIFGDGPNRSRFHALVASLNLSNRVHMLGIVERPWRALRHASLFVLSSRYEGFLA